MTINVLFEHEFFLTIWCFGEKMDYPEKEFMCNIEEIFKNA